MNYQQSPVCDENSRSTRSIAVLSAVLVPLSMKSVDLLLTRTVQDGNVSRVAFVHARSRSLSLYLVVLN